MTLLRTSLRNFLSHKGRTALSAVAVALSVAFVCGTLVFTDTLEAAFHRFFDATAADVTVEAAGEEDAQETGRARTIPASVVERVRAVDGVAFAGGVVFDENVTVADARGEDIGSSVGAPTFGTDWGEATRRIMDLDRGRAPRGPGEVLLDSVTAERAGIGVGEEVTVVAVPGRFEAEVTGVASFHGTSPGATYVLLDPRQAGRALLGDADALSSVQVEAADGVADAELKERIAGALGAGYDIGTRQENADAMAEDVGGFLDVIRYAMLGFAGIAVLVGGFLIVNTFAMLVAQRTRELGLMRALGADRGQVDRTVLTEALLLGLAGSVLGAGGGVALAAGLMELMEAAGTGVDASALTVEFPAPVAGAAVGVLTTLFAAWLPARRAGKVPPMAALREAGAARDGRPGRPRIACGLLLCAGGVAALLAAAGADEASAGSGYLALGLVLTLVGAVVTGPLLALGTVRLVSATVLRPFGPVGRMAERNALRNPRRTGATAGALMIGLAVVGCLSVVGSSAVASASDELERAVSVDFVVESSSGQIPPEAEAAVKDVPGLAHVTDYTLVSVRLTTPDGETVTDEEVTAADPTYATDLRARTLEGELAEAYAPGRSTSARRRRGRRCPRAGCR